MNSFEELEVWKIARQFRISISALIKTFPLEEKYRLVDQMLRASRSITANIAEGFGRFHYQENIQFCRQARGSLFETLEHLTCSYDEKIINKEQYDSLKSDFQNTLRLLNGYIQYLIKAKTQNKTDNPNN
ncbi:MAG: four helix bundle protein [Bacteroidetes bacterium]|nr:four helix bundle protein [Bacteroidota bacterium]